MSANIDQLYEQIAYLTSQLDRYKALYGELPEGNLTEVSNAVRAGIKRLVQREAVSAKSRQAVMARHAAPGGSHDMRDEMRKRWASGQYPSRDACAEACHAALGISFKTARNALTGQPNPHE
ncbi:hypothetical protein [Chromobacterium haemolyticum]|uniref:hypothetical protein n=1 Tax=Chromobacterium haemolyticum TaxID=394935 RepID=UPI001177B94D|nr:hypothetical protein [Chromobacterium haemolyticum]